MKKLKSSWKLGLVVGFSAPLLFSWAMRLLFPPFPKSTLAVARASGRDPYIYHEINLLCKKAEEEHYLSETEWKRVLKLFARPHGRDKADAMRIMAMLSESSRQEEIVKIARENLNHPDNHIQFQALHLLWVCHAPGWHEEAQKRIGSKEQNVREMARSALHKGEYVRNESKK